MSENTNKIEDNNNVEEKKISFDSLKNFLRNLSKNENSLKSISFSVNTEEKELICYFAWKQEGYNDFFVERDIFRKNIISYMQKYGFKLNKKKSNPAKYIFKSGN